jgi:hypothetical protein
MLPNRANFKTQFSPHGVQLMPHRMSPAAPLDPLAVCEAAEDADAGLVDVPIMADSVKRKRRMKIKKHKVGALP